MTNAHTCTYDFTDRITLRCAGPRCPSVIIILETQQRQGMLQRLAGRGQLVKGGDAERELRHYLTNKTDA